MAFLRDAVSHARHCRGGENNKKTKAMHSWVSQSHPKNEEPYYNRRNGCCDSFATLLNKAASYSLILSTLLWEEMIKYKSYYTVTHFYKAKRHLVHFRTLWSTYSIVPFLLKHIGNCDASSLVTQICKCKQENNLKYKLSLH